jgi:hypothetical protein
LLNKDCSKLEVKTLDSFRELFVEEKDEESNQDIDIAKTQMKNLKVRWNTYMQAYFSSPKYVRSINEIYKGSISSKIWLLRNKKIIMERLEGYDGSNFYDVNLPPNQDEQNFLDMYTGEIIKKYHEMDPGYDSKGHIDPNQGHHQEYFLPSLNFESFETNENYHP